MSVSEFRDLSRYVPIVHGLTPRTIATCTTADGDTYNGRTVDRRQLDDRAQSAIASVTAGFIGGPANTKTLSLTLSMQHSSDASSWENFSTANNVTKVIGSTTTSTDVVGYGVAQMRVDLTTARRYIRMVCVPDASATSSEDYGISGQWAFGGLQALAHTGLQGTVSSS